jgi:hypothetical protein
VLRLPRELRNIESWNANPIVIGKRNRRVPERLVYQLVFAKAVKDKPEIALKALDDELDVWERKDVITGTFEHELTDEEKKYITNIMVNYVEKEHPDGSFDKAKSRILNRGDTQIDWGETEGPVCRIESIYLLFNIAIFSNYLVWKIDFVAAYLNTVMPDELKHKWVMLDKTVSKRLITRNPDKWSKYLRKDGKILARVLKLFYGFKEAAFYWNKTLTNMFVENGWKILSKDKCVFIKPLNNNDMAMVALIVDDLTCMAPTNSNIKQELEEICVKYFTEIKVEEGDTINVVGLRFELNREEKYVKITQGKLVKACNSFFDDIKIYDTPYGANFFEDDENDILLSDQTLYRSILMTMSFGAHRTYPELLYGISYLATKQGKAKEGHMRRLKRMLGYIKGSTDHFLMLKPKSLKIVCYADASYGEHEDGKSHTGGVVGFEGFEKGISPIMFISGKQPVVAKSSYEAELIAASTVGDSFVWLKDMMLELGLNESDSVMYQDNKSTILGIEKGGGSFKRTKHIKIRFFWVKALVDEGVLRIEYVPTVEMVADMLTKPLVGVAFNYLSRKITGWFSKEKIGAGTSRGNF